MRRRMIAANWKLHNTVAESVELTRAIAALLSEVEEVDVVLAPTFLALDAVGKEIRGGPIHLAAQNLFWESVGAFTGEVSAPLLKAVGCTHVIVGHSERRQQFGDTDEQVHRRLAAALGAELTPILCLGEQLADRRAGATEEVVKRQLDGAFGDLTRPEIGPIVIAYEPVWAIGTGVTAEPADAQAVHRFIRSRLRERAGEAADRTRILYGGSVTASNSGDLMGQQDIDGVLVGGASLDAEEFVKIVRSGVLG